MVIHYAGVIVTRNGTIDCVCSVAPPDGGELRGVIVCGSFSSEGFLTFPMALRSIATGVEWAPIVRVERVEPRAVGGLYVLSFVAEVGADGIS